MCLIYITRVVLHCVVFLLVDGQLDAPVQHYYPPDSSIPARVPEFYFKLSGIYFILITIGVIFCYPYDKNDAYFKTVIDDAMGNDDGDDDNEDDPLLRGRSSSSSPNVRKAKHLEVEPDDDDTKALLETKPDYSVVNSHQSSLDIGPKELCFEPMSYLFEMCMVFTNVGGNYTTFIKYDVHNNTCTHHISEQNGNK
jgi:hypothetical protein